MRRSFIQSLIRYLGTRNVRLMSKGLPTGGKGMGQWRQGTIQNIKRKSFADPLARPTASQAMGGGRLFTPIGGGKSKFISQSSKVGYARGTKIGGGVAGAGIIGVGTYKYEKEGTPSGAATSGQKQASVVKTRGLSVDAVPQLRKRSKAFMTRTVSQGGKVISAKPYKALSFAGDIVKMSKSGYHKYRPGSAGAKSFQAAYKAAGGKKFKWKEGTGKWYK